ncbi:unnamed protein product [Coccothraustes coccothraustes]
MEGLQELPVHCAGCSCSQRQPRLPVPKPLRRCTTGTCKLHGETAKAHETPKRFCFDQCGQQGCNFCESSIWASWNLPALLAEQSRLVTSMWAGTRRKELTSSPGQPEEVANSVRQIPGVCGDLPRPSENSSRLLPLAALRCWTGRELCRRGYAPPGAGEGTAVLGSKVMFLALWLQGSRNFLRDPTALSSMQCPKDAASVVLQQINLRR